MTTITLTEYERKALAIIRDHGPYRVLSAVGYKLFEGEKEGRKRNPSPQGMALAAGRFLRPLDKQGLIFRHPEIRISHAGRELLAELEAAEATP
jgi:hypothetical protein